MTANLMRITAGAGKPYELLQNIYDVVEAVAEYEATGAEMRVGTFECVLAIEPKSIEKVGDADSLTNSILTAALRIVAARLSGDALPERNPTRPRPCCARRLAGRVAEAASTAYPKARRL